MRLNSADMLKIVRLKPIVFAIVTLLNSLVFSQPMKLRFSEISVDQGLSHSSVMGIVQDKFGFMWFATWDGLNKYDGYKITVYSLDRDNDKTIAFKRIRQLFKDNDGNIWVTGYDSIYCRYNYETDDFTRFTIGQFPKYISDSLNRDQTIYHTYIETPNYIWRVYQFNNILTKNSHINHINYLLTQIDRKTQKEYTYRTDILNKWAISDDYVRCIYADPQGVFWVGTNTGGVNKADLHQKQFGHYQRTMQADSSIVDNNVRAIYVDASRNIWVGTNSKGISKIDGSTGKYTHYKYNPKDSLHSIVNDQIRHIYADRFGWMWFATKGGLTAFNPETNKYRQYWKHNSLPNVWVTWITEDRNGYLWVGSWGGIFKYDRKNDRFDSYPIQTTLKYSSVRAMLEDEKQNFWVATEGGLYYIKRDTSQGFVEKHTVKSYHYQKGAKNTLSDNRVYALARDLFGRIWACTANGLDCLNPTTDSFAHFSKKNGLAEDMILGALTDKSGNIWVSHKKGLTKINTLNFKMRHYAAKDGLQGNEFLEDAYFADKQTGYLYFGGVKGFNKFLPDSIKDNTIPPKVYITGLYIQGNWVGVNEKVNGRVVLSQPIYMTPSISLRHVDRTISFEFAALHYSSPQDNSFEYMLEGFDTKWIKTDARNRIATYSNLPAKTYTFKVRASNCDGVWCENPVELKVKVKPAWWATWLFRLAIILLLVAVSYFSYSIKIQLYKKREKELSKVVAERTQELEDTNKSLLEKNSQIEEQKEELKITNEQLLIQKEELEEKNKEIKSYSIKLETANEELMQQQGYILEQSKRFEEANRQLIVLNATKDRFFSIMAHDLRNPFHVVSGFSEVLLRGYKNLTPDKIEKYLNLINTSSSSGNALLENLLLWSRSQTGRIQFEPRQHQLANLVGEIELFLKGAMSSKNIRFETQIPDGLTVFTDDNIIKTILRNLISNAIKFTFPDGLIEISARTKDSLVEISVTDTGVGIPADIIERLFRIDTNISTKGTANEGGTGLGLILCKEFAEKQGGNIWVESDPGHGSRFTFTVPEG